MRALIVLAVLGACSAVPFIELTPEVAAERAKFFKVFNEAKASASASASAAAAPPNSIYQQAAVTPSVASAPAAPLRWEGPFAATVPAGLEGVLAQVPDTLDVETARKAFLASYQAQLAATKALPSPVAPAPALAPAPAPAPAPVPAAPAVIAKWAGPFASTKPAAVDGPLTPVGDTADVTAATAEFLRAYKAAVVATAPAPAAPAPAIPAPVAPAAPAPAATLAAAPVAETLPARWAGPAAATVPAGLPGSFAQVPDTPEVSAAREAFFRVYQQAALAAPKA